MKRETTLSNLNVLILDCQASGANPGNGHLMEIGWVKMKASQTLEAVESSIQSHLVRLPEEEEVPFRISRITGIKTEDLEEGLTEKDAWERLIEVVQQVMPNNTGVVCPTVIHFYRYEDAFLRHLHREYAAGEVFPYDIICTHQLVRRLLPKLPGKGLRAIAGYFGHSVPELRRSAHHIEATVVVWHHVVKLLEEKGIRTLTELRQWLDKPITPSRNVDREFPMPREIRTRLPNQPGIYRMLRSNGDLLYIGKATSLKKRVNSYFHQKKRSAQAKLTMEMLTQAVNLEVTVTGSALEAALLETDEIKRHSPPYNVALRQRDREVAFFSRDLEQSSPNAGDDYVIGPLPSLHSLSAFCNIQAVLTGELTVTDDEEDMDICSLVLGMPPDYAPDTGCFLKGVEIFKQKHNELLEQWGNEHFLSGLMVLGKQFRKKKLEEMELAALAEEEENEEEPGEEEAEEERVWTPEDVTHVMESIVRRGAHLIRRSRWFCLLSESALAWETGETSNRQRRLIMLQEGAITLQEDIESDVPVPLPPGHGISFGTRRRSFDVMTYDRLRVLTTELRRLAEDKVDRNLQLRVSPAVILRRQQLRKIFRWV
ncbi:MAG: GIY-YIG nuclease family protein [bacterium]|nr:GIY-YIG nuclease family protein [bacterium]